LIRIATRGVMEILGLVPCQSETLYLDSACGLEFALT